jgi:hypothetical protein
MNLILVITIISLVEISLLQTVEKRLEIKSEFSNFLKKYRSNSCIMEVFSYSQKKCEELNDDEYSQLSLRMTFCIVEKTGKKVNFNCDFTNIKDCLSKVEGDLWTTYVTFLQHIDNLCFYYKTLLWEKSSEFLFSKLLNSSILILNGLTESNNIAERILKTQERLGTEVETSFNNSITKLRNFSKQIESFQKIEKSLKNDIVIIHEKVRSSEDKFSSFSRFIENKINFIYTINSIFDYSDSQLKVDSFKFYLFTLLYIYFLTTFDSTKSFRNFLVFSVIVYFISERNLVIVFCNDIFYQYIIFYICRIVYIGIILVMILVKAYYFKSMEKENSEQLLGLKYDFNHFIRETPYWVKKYFSKLSTNNEELVEKFRKLQLSFKNIDKLDN